MSFVFSIMSRKKLSLYITIILSTAVIYIFAMMPGNVVATLGFHGVDNEESFALFSPEVWFSFFSDVPLNTSSVSWADNTKGSNVILDTESDTKVSSLVSQVKYQEVTHSLSYAEKDHLDSLIGAVFSSFPKSFVAPLQELTFRVDDKGTRGLAGSDRMILRTEGVSDQELASVSIHELGHIVDLGMFKGTSSSGTSNFKDGTSPIYMNDLSIDFYSISWVTETKLRSDASSSDFVSGYAMSDPFEDFAETFVYYVLQGKEFKRLASEDDALQEKYNFMKFDVFQGKEFLDNDESYMTTSLNNRPWDATKEPYPMEMAFHAKQ